MNENRMDIELNGMNKFDDFKKGKGKVKGKNKWENKDFDALKVQPLPIQNPLPPIPQAPPKVQVIPNVKTTILFKADNNTVYLFMIINKIMLILVAYLAVKVATQYMSNVYIQDTLIDEKDTVPSIMGFVVVFGLLLIGGSITSGLLLYMIQKTMFGEADLVVILMENMLYSMLLIGLTTVISIVIENKQFFLYEDDGLRAYRALSSIVIYIAIIIALIPINKIIK
jgi:hypothetical protein